MLDCRCYFSLDVKSSRSRHSAVKTVAVRPSELFLPAHFPAGNSISLRHQLSVYIRLRSVHHRQSPRLRRIRAMPAQATTTTMTGRRPTERRLSFAVSNQRSFIHSRYSFDQELIPYRYSSMLYLGNFFLKCLARERLKVFVCLEGGQF